MEDTFKAITLWLATGTEGATALIIGLASIEGTIRALVLFVPGLAPSPRTGARRTFG